MDKSKLKDEPLLLEYYKNGAWRGTYKERDVQPYREYAHKALMENPDRYVYINQLVRISYYEGLMRPWSRP